LLKPNDKDHRGTFFTMSLVRLMGSISGFLCKEPKLSYLVAIKDCCDRF
jgi:hypothetical protein